MMEIISFHNGSATRYWALDEWLPRDISDISIYTEAIAQHFGFRNIENSTSATAVGMISPSYKNGAFTHEGELISVMGLDIQPQRIVAVCSTTNQSILALDYLAAFLSELGFRAPDREVVDLLASSLIVDLGPRFLAKTQTFMKLSNIFADYLGEDTTLEAQGLKFAGHKNLHGLQLPVFYILEDRTQRPPGTNWLFSQAPLSTDLHVELLNKIAAMLK